jgi:hypothetical protein
MATVPAQVIALFGTSIISYLPLAETSGSAAEDAYTTNRDGAYSASGLTLNNVSHLAEGAPLFNGSAGYVNWYTTSLRDAFNGAAGTFAAWVKVNGSSVWTDGIARRIVSLGAGASNFVLIAKTALSNQLNFQYGAGGTIETVSVTSYTNTNWFHVVVTWDKAADQFKAYIDGAQVGSTQTGLGTWAGTLLSTTTLLGAANLTPANAWHGWEHEALLLNRAATLTEIQDLHALVPFETLFPTLYSANSTFTPPTFSTGPVVVSPARLNSTASVPTPVVSTGPVDVSPARIASTTSVAVPTVSTGPVDVEPSRLTQSPSFGAAVLSTGAVGLSPARLTDAATFGSPTVVPGAVSIQPTRVNDPATFGSPTVSGANTLIATLFTDPATFGSPVVSQAAAQTLLPTRLTDPATFGAPIVSQSGGPQTLIALLFQNGVSFGSPRVYQPGSPYVVIGSLPGRISVAGSGSTEIGIGAPTGAIQVGE